MNITSHTGGVVQTNGFIVESDSGTVVIDAPGGIAAFLRTRKLTPDALLLTHQHFDHVEDAAALADMGATIFAHSAFSHDLILDEVARRWGLPVEIPPFTVDTRLAGEESVEAGGVRFAISHVPGHSPDSICFHLPEAGTLFGGDTLFAGSIGRTDFPGGDHPLLLAGIRAKLFTLPD
ncbi:MAG: MBL fold metallo-hydrolase, partial [Akkermansiaceae bacterium]|nr:MBL fold metallo-hydrolase [Akkermansiaceae bacterium]